MSSATDFTPSLCMMLARWLSTVRTPMSSSPATSRLDRPLASQASTSRSRAVSEGALGPSFGPRSRPASCCWMAGLKYERPATTAATAATRSCTAESFSR